MKKIVSTFALALLVGGLTFAQDASVKVGAWGRGLFIPVITGGQIGGEDATGSALGVSWGGVPRVGFTVSGTSEAVGFQADINADVDGSGKVSLGDQQKIWVKPFEGVTIQVGQAYDDTLRGNGTFGSFDWVRRGAGWAGEDLTFTRLDTGGGFEVSYAAGDLYVFGAFKGLGGSSNAKDLNKVVLKTTQEGIGYTIKDVGQIRVQAIGRSVTVDDSYNDVQAAFKLTAVENLYADVGINFPTDKDLAGKGSTISAYANYTMDKAKIHALFVYGLPAEGSDATINGGVGLDYGLDGGLALSTDLRYQNKFAAGNEDGLTNFFVGLTKGFSNGLIGVGLQYATILPGSFGVSNPDENGGLMLPIRAEYWF